MAFTSKNYITIQGWMIQELGLSGNELIAYALIYGFSQDGETEFSGSFSYIAEAINISKMSVIRILGNLEKKNLIVKNQNIKNGTIHNTYTVVKDMSDNDTQKSQGGSNKMLPAPNIYNNIYNNNPPILTNVSICPPLRKNAPELPLDGEIIPSKKIKKFQKPSLDEWLTYCREKNLDLNTMKSAYESYDVADWHDSQGNPIRNWKQKILQVWATKAPNRQFAQYRQKSQAEINTEKSYAAYQEFLKMTGD